ncbi:hypothetical protein L0U95_28935 (plasmid) [Burkholderia cenocepacia]|nr:hypothetical protein L0U95_28935 [Burkholderia cenocepacia]
MTGLTIEYGVPPARRHAARAAPRTVAAVARPPSLPPSAQVDARAAPANGWRGAAAIALAIAALHAGVALLAARAPAALPVQPPRPLPMTVERRGRPNRCRRPRTRRRRSCRRSR